MHRQAAVVTWDDLKNFFKGEIWQKSDFSEDRFQGRTRTFSVDLEPEKVQFWFRIEATDDPSDSEEGVSSDPVKDIAKFLGRDLPGGEFFERMSCRPQIVSKILVSISDAVLAKTPSRSVMTASLRRVAILPHLKQAMVAMRYATVMAVKYSMARFASMESNEFEKLESSMDSKGWEISKRDNDGREELVVNISDIYEAVIHVDSILYNYTFQYADHPDLTKSGTTTDPIKEFSNYYRSDEITDAIAAKRKPKPDSDDSPLSFQETVLAEKDVGDEKGTVPAGPKRQKEESA